MRPWWIRLAPHARPRARGLLLIALLMLTGVGLDVLKPWPAKLLVDHVLTGRAAAGTPPWMARLVEGPAPAAAVGYLAGATVALFLASQALVIAQGYVSAGVGNRLVYDLGAELFDHLQQLSLRFHGRRPAGDLVRRVMNESGCLRDLVLGVLFPIGTALVSVFAMLAVMWRLDRTLALAALLAAPALALLIRIFGPPMEQRSHRELELRGEGWSLAAQVLRSIPLVQSFCREEHEADRFRRLSAETAEASLRTVAAQLQFQYTTNGVTAAGTAAAMFLGGWHVWTGSLTVGGLLVFLSYLASFYAPLATLTMTSTGYANAAAGARRVLEVLETDEAVRDAPGALPLPARREGEGRRVQLENVTFGYEPGRPVLHGVSLEAQPGETIALVGHTGAGKTTLVSLIPRLYDPWEGRVLVDGMDVRQARLAVLRRQVAVVLQDPFLLPLSVADNIGYGRPGASRAEIEAAAAAANADGFIRRLPQGYDTVIGERGATLSGGEKQRLAIARALVKDAPILILDEPTAALDAHSESLLVEALDRLRLGRTTFIIAHRLSTIRRADRVVVVEGGRVVEEGAHEELVANGDRYSRFS